MLYFYTENLKDKWAALIQGFGVSSFILTGKKKQWKKYEKPLPVGIQRPIETQLFLCALLSYWSDQQPV